MAEKILIEAEVQDRADRWYRLQVRPHRAADGLADGVILTLMDIQDLKREVATAEWARDYARSIVEAVQVPLVVLDAGLRVLSANAAYHRLLGEEPGGAAGRGLFELGAGAWDAEELKRAVAAVRGAGGTFQALELERDFPGAGRRTVSVSGCAVASPGEPLVLLAIEDVTERRGAERRQAELLGLAEEAQRRAERADAAKDAFLAGVSHELRTPLTTVLLQAELLLKDSHQPGAVQRAGASIQASARRQARLVEDLLDVSRIDSGKIRLSLEEVDLGKVVREVVGAMEPEAALKQVGLLAEHAGEPALCRGDPERLQQIVSNLLANAIKFTPGGGRVDVRIEAVDGSVRLVVADTGRGIAPAFLPQVFERFAQEASAASGEGGLGLGLSIVHHLVALHGGTVRAESAGPGQGATFVVALPKHAATAEASG
jgi:two-component system CheB/CheR fusion protein